MTLYRSKLRSQKFILAVIGFIVFLLGLRLFLFIDKYAVNILFWDQWDFLRPVFNHDSVWTLFTWQHGPHRQGIGMVISQIWLNLSHWNSRVDSFAVGIIVFLTMGAALILKRRLFGSWSYSDIAIPLALLSIGQYETFIGSPNSSHSALPILLAVLLTLSWTINHPLRRTICVLIINFLAIFTGFGIFLGIITPLLFSIESVQAYISKVKDRLYISLAGLLVSIISGCLFFVGYTFNPAVSCFKFSLVHWRSYFKFMSVMWAKFINVDNVMVGSISIWIGALIIIALLIGLAYSLLNIIKKGFIKENSINLSAVILIGYALIFTADASIGRMCIGSGFAGSSRYMTIISLGFVGLYLFLKNLKNNAITRATIIVFTLILCFGLLPFALNDQYIINTYYLGKTGWKACFLKSENFKACNSMTDFRIYPDLTPQIIKELNYLKANHLNLYLDGPKD